MKVKSKVVCGIYYFISPRGYSPPEVCNGCGHFHPHDYNDRNCVGDSCDTPCSIKDFCRSFTCVPYTLKSDPESFQLF